MKKVLLRASQIQKRYKELEILNSISLEVHEGEAIAIMGASGEGKSTLLHILGTLEAPTSGVLEIVGETVLKSNAHLLRSKHIGFVFQAFHLLEDYTPFENIVMPARIARLQVAPAASRADELLKKVGLSQRAHFKTSLLSGGEKQRVAIARALCNNPSVILADEPSGNLDHRTSQEIHNLLLQLAKEQNKGLIIVTHDASLAALCDRTLFLRNGTLHAA